MCLRFVVLSRENLLADCLQGCFVVTCTLCAFISLVWLREQIIHGGAPQWLEHNLQAAGNMAAQANEVSMNPLVTRFYELRSEGSQTAPPYKAKNTHYVC